MILGRFCCVFNKIPLRLCLIKISSFVMGKILTWILLNTQQNLPRINLVICWLWSLIIFMFHRYLFQPCLYPMKTVHLGILHIPTHGGVAGAPGMILGDKFRSWANFPWFFQKRDSLF
jgi:hypothetical protein